MHLVLDTNTYLNKKLFLYLKKHNLKFIAYVNKEILKNEYVSDIGFNIINLDGKEIDLKNLKQILNQTKKSLIIFKTL